jgi:hypothetical protein
VVKLRHSASNLPTFFANSPLNHSSSETVWGPATLAHGAVRFLLRVLEATLLVVLLGSAFLAWRLSQGPIALNAVVALTLRRCSTISIPSLQFRIDRAEFRWQGFQGQPRDHRPRCPCPRHEGRRRCRVAHDGGAARVLLAAQGRARAAPCAAFKPHHSICSPQGRHLCPWSRRARAREQPDKAPGGVETSGNALAVTLLDALTGTGATGGLAYLETVVIDGTTLVLAR